MTTLVQHARKSLFFRLLAIFGVTAVLFIIIIFISLQTINDQSADIESIPDYFTRNIESIIADIGTPPNLGNAMRLADELNWTINVRNPIMQWSSDAENRLDVDFAVYSESLTSDAELRTINGEDIIRVQRGGYDFYMYRRATNSNNLFLIYVGVALAIGILFLNYLMVNRMLDPVRLLRRGAERIQKGDLGYRVKTNRQDELGELTESINHMADSLQSMLEAKRQLLMAISHELRTPITKAKLRMEFMPESVEKDQLKEDIDEIDLLISDLLEAERLNNEHAVLVSEPVYFAEFVRGVTEQFRQYEGGVTVEKPDEDLEFELDKLRVRLLITNLLNNAMRHGEENPIKVKVTFIDDRGIIEVIDNGEGISEEHLSQISEPFYRADSSRQRNTGGFGLGLYLCRLIAQAHGGEMIIASKIGEGTHITVNLPRHPPLSESE
ncbi:MAG: HAMP domain-containing sensor histidine kinase [Gammaproteobacteria bacterium]|nr:HAMP domain-containing sensor histidine kinase [Gammaproteobacteria bacterium]MDD9896496.1 HAMP domain-containing sensor histidine kinase [Gammaproteobacteria bacterium]MDD9958749.1 HAMP domain-containing sensor histidine kinase [Gammaproteobacteria bacterium]